MGRASDDGSVAWGGPSGGTFSSSANTEARRESCHHQPHQSRTEVCSMETQAILPSRELASKWKGTVIPRTDHYRRLRGHGCGWTRCPRFSWYTYSQCDSFGDRMLNVYQTGVRTLVCRRVRPMSKAARLVTTTKTSSLRRSGICLDSVATPKRC